MKKLFITLLAAALTAVVFAGFANARPESFIWKHYGGEPYHEVHSWKQAKQLILGSRGTYAAARLGISHSCWGAVRLAASQDNYRVKGLHWKQHFAKMIYGSGIVAYDVSFQDSAHVGVTSWVITARCGGTIIVVTVPTCGNISENLRHAPRPAPAPVAPIRRYPVYLQKQAFLNNQPTVGEFSFQLWFNGRSWKRVTIRSDGSLLLLGRFRPGNTITAVDLSHDFQADGGASRTVTTRRGATIILFVNRKSTPQMAPVYIQKVCEDAYGNKIACPTNTFPFRVTCSDGTVMDPVVFNPNPGEDRITAGMCHVGSSATATEKVPNGWRIATGVPNPQTLTLTATGAQFVFKDQQLPPTPSPTPQPSPTPVNQPPSVQLTLYPKQIRATGQDGQVCAEATDPEGAHLMVTFQATYGMISASPTSVQGSTYCTWYNAPSSWGYDDTITVTVSDGVNKPVSDSKSFPVEQS